jgi:hypothetical protein
VWGLLGSGSTVEITQFTYFQQAGGIDLKPVSAELTYGTERIAMYLQGVESVYDLEWTKGITYGEIHQRDEFEFSTYNFQESDPVMIRDLFDKFEAECRKIIQKRTPAPRLPPQMLTRLSSTPGAMGLERLVHRQCGRSRNSARRYPRKGEWFLPRKRIPAKDLIRDWNREIAGFGGFIDKLKTYPAPRTRSLREYFVLARSGAPGHGPTDNQEDRSREFYGPPVRIAFDEKGNPTNATIGFAKSQGVDVKDLVTVTRDRGEFLAAVKKIKGQKTEKLLKELLPRIITGLPFRKSMKWGDGEAVFARPIRWLLAVYGGKTIHFNIEEVKSSSKSRGHRFMSPKPFTVSGWDDYAEGLEKGFVVLDQDRRKSIIERGINDLAEKIGGTALKDEELLETVTYLVDTQSLWVISRGFPETPEKKS